MLKNMPLIPHNLPINPRVKSITRGLKFSDFPISLGSIIFPIRIWINVENNRIINGWKKSRNCTKENKNGNNIETTEPKKGIKFNINANRPNNIAKSLLNKNKTRKVKMPVNKLVSVLIWKYPKISFLIFSKIFFDELFLNNLRILILKKFSSKTKKIKYNIINEKLLASEVSRPRTFLKILVKFNSSINSV